MATFFVDSTGVVTTASVDSDSIFIQSAALKDSTILGEAGADTINLLEGVATDASAVGVVVRGVDGNDSSRFPHFSQCWHHPIRTRRYNQGFRCSTLGSRKPTKAMTLSSSGAGTTLNDLLTLIPFNGAAPLRVNLGNGHDTYRSCHTPDCLNH